MLCIFCFLKPANSKQAWPECHISSYNKLLTKLLEPYWGILALGRFCILPRSRANILQYGPRARLALATISIDFSFLPFSCVYFHTSIGPAFHIDAVFIQNKTVWPCLLSSVIQLADFARYEVIVALALEFVFV